MIIFNTIEETRRWLSDRRADGKTSGFVPTMGALHPGHLQLISRSCQENDITGCSIFVNPIQFTNPEDLSRYPRTPDDDLRMLEKAGCHLVFVPSVEEMYPEPVTEKYDFGELERVMEGAYRQGHFNGVAIVVKKLLDIFGPDKAYFGEKDFQQLRIIQELVKMEKMPVEIVPCATVRESDGLAVSSRNRRLNPEQRIIAADIFRTLQMARELVKTKTVAEVKEIATARISEKGFVVDYFEIANSDSLQPATSWEEDPGVIACVAAYLGKVRLIDNMILFSNFAG
jgi:pantoate--beta-alanine ligase